MTGVEFEGFDEAEEALREIQEEVEELAEDREVQVGELFTRNFMQEHTDFESLDEMVESSQWQVESQEDFEAIPDDEWDTFVAENTRFDDWKGMMGRAQIEYYKKEVDL